MKILESYLELFCKRIKILYNNQKNIFLFSLMLGVISHFVILADYLYNHDAISSFYTDLNWLIDQGKWFASPIVSLLRGKMAVHYISGLVGIIFIALTVVIIINIFDVKNKFAKMLIASLFVMFSSVTVCLNYNALDYFAISLFLAMVAAFMTKKKNVIGWFCAVIFLTLSLGSYQGYIGFTAVIFVYICIGKLLNTDVKISDVIKEGIYYITVLLSSILSYYIVLQIIIHIQQIELSSYKGINNMTQNLQPLVLLNSFFIAWKNVIGYLWNDNIGMKASSTIFLYRMFFAVIILIIMKKIIQILINKEPIRAILVFVLSFLCVPLAINLTGILSNNSSFYFVTSYPLVMLFVGGILLVFGEKNICDLMTRGIVCVLVTSIGYNMFLVNNVQYEKDRYTAMQVNAKAIELVTAIHGTEGVNGNTTIVIVGNAPYDVFESRGISEVYDEMFITGISSPSQIMYSENILFGYLTNVLSYDFKYEGYDNYQENYSDVIDKMPIFPQYGSLKLIDGKLFVKLSSSY